MAAGRKIINTGEIITGGVKEKHVLLIFILRYSASKCSFRRSKQFSSYLQLG